MNSTKKRLALDLDISKDALQYFVWLANEDGLTLQHCISDFLSTKANQIIESMDEDGQYPPLEEISSIEVDDIPF